MQAVDLTDKDARQIAQRLSLRPPQCDALEMLSRVAAAFRPHKDADQAAALASVKAVIDHAQKAGMAHTKPVQSFESFERDFMNLCFSLATGVGKTRLMGAFIAFLHKKYGLRHFFVVAPNLTIYEKLKQDFGNPTSAKYVFAGLEMFASERPLIITGDDYEDGRGVRDEARIGAWQPDLRGVNTGRGGVHINIFNISKFAKDTKPGTDNKPARIKRIHECLGQAYFSYLAGLLDLVLIMDEAHNYRASAGANALNELNPVLGLELTATPFRTQGTERITRVHPETKVSSQVTVPKRIWFENVLYDYQLRDAMNDGFVKEPCVAYRKNTDAAKMGKGELELKKLNDAIDIHEETKTDLYRFAVNNRSIPVKPFILVVAEDTTHANSLKTLIESDGFHKARFRGKVIIVHSRMDSADKQENLRRLLDVELSENTDEIVIHVESLKEGWDVTNLYTLVPLRAADTAGLVLQSMGRGLRLPYGKRVTKKNEELSPVDRLTVIAHDRYNDILDEAKFSDSGLTGFVRGRDLDADAPERAAPVTSRATAWIAAKEAAHAAVRTKYAAGKPAEIKDAVDRHVSRVVEVLEKVIGHIAAVRNLRDINKAEIQEQFAKAVEAEMAATAEAQPELPTVPMPTVREILQAACAAFVDKAIEIPKITVVPSVDHKLVYTDFDLDVRHVGWQRPVQDLEMRRVRGGELIAVPKHNHDVFLEERPENYIIRQLVDRTDIDYDDNPTLFQKLAGQFAAHLRGYLESDADVFAVIIDHEKEAGRLVYEQLLKHRRETASTWTIIVHPAFETLTPAVFKNSSGVDPIDLRQEIADKSRIRRYVFTGFARCGGQFCKFDSDGERRFAVILENDKTVAKWMKPAAGKLRLDWRLNGKTSTYEPDFVVETATSFWLAEVKADNEVDTPEVLAKADAGRVWCQAATDHALNTGGKSWRYALLPDSKVKDNIFNFDGLIAHVGVAVA